MARLTALLAAAALTTAVSSPAFAGCWGAAHKQDVTAEVSKPEKTEEAMTTFDPVNKPAFEEAAEAADIDTDEDVKIEE